MASIMKLNAPLVTRCMLILASRSSLREPVRIAITKMCMDAVPATNRNNGTQTILCAIEVKILQIAQPAFEQIEKVFYQSAVQFVAFCLRGLQALPPALQNVIY